MGSRLHQVLAVGMQAGDALAAGMSAMTIADENDPMFLMLLLVQIPRELANIVDPPDPNAAYYAQQSRLARYNRHDSIGYIPEEDKIPPATPAVLAQHNAAVLANNQRRARLNHAFEAAKFKLRNQMSPALQQRFDQILQ